MSERKNMSKTKLSLHKLAVPIFMEMALRNCTVLIITFMVSVYSNHLVPALGAGNEVYELVLIVFSFVTQGCSVVLSQALGARKKEMSSKIVHQSIFLNLCLGLICAAFIYLNANFLLHLLNIPKDLMPPSAVYLRLLSICLAVDAVCMIITIIIRVHNFAYFTTLASLLMDIATVVLSYVFLNHTSYGILGVGCAMLGGRVVNLACLMLAYHFKIKVDFVLKKLICFHKDVVKKLLTVGMFGGGEYLVWGVQYIIAFSFVALLGDTALGVQTIFFQISVMMMLTGIAISQANSIIVGKLIGARKNDLAFKHALRALMVCVGASVGVAVIVFFARFQIMAAFNLNEAYIKLMAPLFAISIVLELARTLNILTINSLLASGDVRFPFYNACIFMLGLSLPLGYYLCFHAGFGLIGIWFGFLADESVRAILHTWRWFSRRWEGKQLV